MSNLSFSNFNKWERDPPRQNNHRCEMEGANAFFYICRLYAMGRFFILICELNLFHCFLIWFNHCSCLDSESRNYFYNSWDFLPTILTEQFKWTFVYIILQILVNICQGLIKQNNSKELLVFMTISLVPVN